MRERERERERGGGGGEQPGEQSGEILYVSHQASIVCLLTLGEHSPLLIASEAGDDAVDTKQPDENSDGDDDDREEQDHHQRYSPLTHGS